MTLLLDIVVTLGLSMVVLLICNYLKIPSVVGFLISGLLAGPHGLALVEAVEEVEMLSEIGVILLLFTIGIEFSFKNLMLIRKSVLIGGSLQVLITIVIVVLIGIGLNMQINKFIFLGFLLSLSSTAIVLKLLQERGEFESPQGRTALALLIFQDIIVVLMMLMVPVLADMNGEPINFELREGNPLVDFIILIVKAVLVITVVVYSSMKLMPKLLFQIARTRSSELFLISVIVICFSVAGLTSIVGLSLALGAFLAGLIISESEYSQEALGNILPFRDVFASFFFISIGMLFNTTYLVQHPLLILGLTLGVLIMKTMIAGFAANALGFPLRTSILTGLIVSQVGEFSFILAKSGLQSGLIGEMIYQYFLSVSILTMVSTPGVMKLAPKIAETLSRLPLPSRISKGIPAIYKAVEKKEKKKNLQDHLVIIGYGINGRNVAAAARYAQIPYSIIEMNPDVVKKERLAGERIYYGDAMKENILHLAGVRKARIIVIAISDPPATRRTTSMVRSMNYSACIIVRTKYMTETDEILRLGGNEVVCEEFETSVEIFSRVMMKYLVPREEIESFITKIRQSGDQPFNTLGTRTNTIDDLQLHLSDMVITTTRIENDALVGRSLADMELRNNFGCTVLAVRRKEELHLNPTAQFQLEKEDLLILFGKNEQNDLCIKHLKTVL